MNTPQPKPQKTVIEHDMFDYPHLYPSGWKLDDVQVKRKTQKQPMPEGYEKFPEPKTFPAGWTLEK